MEAEVEKDCALSTGDDKKMDYRPSSPASPGELHLSARGASILFRHRMDAFHDYFCNAHRGCKVWYAGAAACCQGEDDKVDLFGFLAKEAAVDMWDMWDGFGIENALRGLEETMSAFWEQGHLHLETGEEKEEEKPAALKQFESIVSALYTVLDECCRVCYTDEVEFKHVDDSKLLGDLFATFWALQKACTAALVSLAGL